MATHNQQQNQNNQQQLPKDLVDLDEKIGAIPRGKKTAKSQVDLIWAVKRQLNLYSCHNRPITRKVMEFCNIEKDGSDQKNEKFVRNILARPETDYPSINKQMQKQIDQWIADEEDDEEDDEDVLIVKYGITIKRNDIRTLRWETHIPPLSKWLTDHVVNFYMSLIADRSKSYSSLPQIHSMDSSFTQYLLGGKSVTNETYQNVRIYTQDIDIFSKDLILIPYDKRDSHWCLSIINMMDKTIKYYDSYHTPNQRLLNALA
ncbi:sentrin-specific protease 1-like, partial [Contarinia nasturtii]|uniref:sentrin-specific protease 1-like n=1 Tax=Contarinia nasturtii TaxID=265458 RepID=UPI0012D4A1AC